jgi:hypothetical protein
MESDMTRFRDQVRGLIFAPLLALMMAFPALAQDYRLLMVEQVGCYVCTAFNRDVAPAYAASAESDFAPLVHVQLRGTLPEGVTLASEPFVTPTFILIGPDGAEIERMIGFPGEDFFWPYINQMFDRARGEPSG